MKRYILILMAFWTYSKSLPIEILIASLSHPDPEILKSPAGRAAVVASLPEIMEALKDKEKIDQLKSALEANKLGTSSETNLTEVYIQQRQSMTDEQKAQLDNITKTIMKEMEKPTPEPKIKVHHTIITTQLTPSLATSFSSRSTVLLSLVFLIFNFL